MIAAVRSWLTSIAAVTLMLTVVQTLVPEGTIKKIAGFTGGLLLLAALLQPALKTDLGRLRLDFSDYEKAIETRAEELDAAGKDELAFIIAGRTAAYISDKADALGLRVAARVETEPGADGETPLPASVDLTGPYSRELADWIAVELGIPAERQVWHEGKN
nr:stage III sporulation protein AF [uncultured Oscillibacter sp.]